MTISEFARLVGLAPSALRFYDDCGLLPPAEVDATNGYRYYDPSQAVRARLLRDLREIDLPLPDVRLALDAPADEVAELVRAHLRTLEAKSTATRDAATRLLTQLLSQQTTAVLGGPEFASAVRQVAPTAAPTDEFPGLDCVLIELSPEEITFVATDRYRLAMRTVRPVEFGGATGRVLVPAADLAAVTRWAAAGDVVRINVTNRPTPNAPTVREPADGEPAGGAPAGGAPVDGGPGAGVPVDTARSDGGRVVGGPGVGGLVLVRGDESRELAVGAAEYPAYQQILDGLAPPVCRVVVDRVALLGALAGRDVVVLDVEPEALRIGDDVRLDAIGSGTVRVGFTASMLAAALEASVGPDVLLEICEPARPVVVRSADQGTFTTLVMPVRLDG